MLIKDHTELCNLQKEEAIKKDKLKKKVMVCFGPGCLAVGAPKISAAFRKELENKNIKDIPVEVIHETGCFGFCQQGPLVIIEPEGTFYTKVKPRDIEEIVEKSLIGNEAVTRLLYKDINCNQHIEKQADIPFYKGQHRIAMRNLGRIQADSISDYIALSGYQALAKVLTTMTPEEVIKEITESGLRGRGGGGFPAGRKWQTCRNAEGKRHFVICNGDEGDPGAFMDRGIMEGDPHTVLEGMMIAAYAIGASEGYIYVREEYPLAVANMQKAIDDCTDKGLLGDNILSTDFSLVLKVAKGAGAFVCGESSALMKSVAGEVGEPRAKYVRSVIKGLYDQPTLLNNVETFASVPVIIEKGGKWYKSIGTPKSSGTKAFSLVGKVKNTGLIEVPMGMTLREIIFDIGGGIIDDRPFKAVQTGGPSGGCLPESKLDLPVDFESLTEAGSMMGSGGMIVMDDLTCMVDITRYFLAFLVEESCGKCVPCREGLYQLHSLAVKICEGKAIESDLDLMENLSKTISIGSLCGLGTSGANPFLSTVKYFREEYLVHIRDKKCPAGVCRDLIRYDINDKCTGCLACIPACPTEAITGSKGEIHTLEQEKCTQCGGCYAVCNFEAIDIT